MDPHANPTLQEASKLRKSSSSPQYSIRPAPAAHSATMEASAGLVAGSHNRNELVLIRGHEEVRYAIDRMLHLLAPHLCLFLVLLIHLVQGTGSR